LQTSAGRCTLPCQLDVPKEPCGRDIDCTGDRDRLDWRHLRQLRRSDGDQQDLEAREDLETQKDAETKKDPETGEQSIEYLVEGLTEEELKQVSGGMTPGLATKCPARVQSMFGSRVPQCVSYHCGATSPRRPDDVKLDQQVALKFLPRRSAATAPASPGSRTRCAPPAR